MADEERMESVGTPAMNDLDRKVTAEFSGYTVRKDLVSKVKGNALVPSYVLEYLLSKYATTTDENSVQAGVERVRAILADNYVHREEANLIQSKIREKGIYNIIDKVQVTLNEKLDQYEATFENLGISRVVVDPQTIKNNPKLMVTGIWCMCALAYAYSGDPKDVPWRLQKLTPVQMSKDDRENYLAMRGEFTADEWIDLLMQSVGFNPDLFGRRAKLLHLVRMVPFVERNYNLIELGPKGTGKSHIYSEFSPHGMLISGGEVTAAKLFVNNSTGQIGLVGYWDTVAFDEFAGKTKKANRALVDIMKNYMANKSFSRGRNTMQAEASMVFVGNTSHNVPYMLKNSDLFEELPAQYHDPAFLDRIHCYLPGWEFEQIRSEMFTRGYGFVVDYLAEILHNLRNVDYGSAFERYFTLSPTLSTRDKDGVRKTFSGLMKLVYPSGEASMDEMEPLLRCAIEGRKRVKDQLCRIDTTMAPVEFSYTRMGSTEPVAVRTVEEMDWPDLYHRPWSSGQFANAKETADGEDGERKGETVAQATSAAGATGSGPTATPTVEATQPRPAPALKGLDLLASRAKTGRVQIDAGRRGITYAKLFGPWLAKAHRIVLQDPYIRASHQLRNLAEFMETVYNCTERSEEVRVHLVTGRAATNPSHPDAEDQQIDGLRSIANAYRSLGITFTYEFKDDIHDRSITTDTGWVIDIGKGLDIYERFDTNWLNPAMRLQQLRTVGQSIVINYNRAPADES